MIHDICTGPGTGLAFDMLLVLQAFLLAVRADLLTNTGIRLDIF